MSNADDITTLLHTTFTHATNYLTTLSSRPVFPSPTSIARLKELDHPLSTNGHPPFEVISLLHDVASPATVASAGGKYFGFVTGGSLPAALAANWLAGAWDQNCSLSLMSPATVQIENIALGWCADVLGLPKDCAGAFVTGATSANLAGLAAARRHILLREGWDVEEKGLFGAPEITVLVGGEVHVSVTKALGMLGFGRSRVVRVPVDGQGRMRPDAMPPLNNRTIVCVQAGNVNTGAIDPMDEICASAREAGAWVHVDGAFGLWAAASSKYARLTKGADMADSWATDGHKYLNVPYDCGIVMCRHKESLRGAMMVPAPYLITDGGREPQHYGPEFSRRARGVDVWAALLSLGKNGVADLVERTCAHAKVFAGGLKDAGYEILNDVVLNQVLVSFGDDEITRRVVAGVQQEGTTWMGGSVWKGRAVMRISVSSWATSDEDVRVALEAIIKVAGELCRGG
eukprot:comp11661_c0_seq1/m.6173 comp11661_c0_seq1/g.6173  ORF comp11661_c0_seq1/g.6173 comp11661_c0_seq1/m.6173 type:complete len:459 (-) comp11661_c0_seq1:33-1409(-)